MPTSTSLSVNKNGFTLVELLISISIIAILSAIGLIAYTSVLKQGRDSKRQSDLRSIQSALEQYNHDQGFYPASAPNPIEFGDTNSLTSTTGNPSPPSPAKIYMNAVPKDPDGSPEYSYTSSSSTGAACDNTSTNPKCTTYCLYANLDNPISGFTKPSGCTAATHNFAVTPP